MSVRPDFDIWILTLDPGNIKKDDFELIYGNFDSNKHYILPEYTCNKSLSTRRNVHFVENKISDLKNELSRNEKIKFYGFGFITSAVLLLFGSYLIIKKFRPSKY